MRLSRLYSRIALSPGPLQLDDDASDYLLKVLRLRPGDSLRIFDGTGGEYAAMLVECTRRSSIVDVQTFIETDKESPLKITLVQGLAALEKLDLVVQKATELGAARITPVAMARSQGRNLARRAMARMQRWENIAISAASQCGRAELPTIDQPMSLTDWLASGPATPILTLDPGARSEWPKKLKTAATLVVGPEGGMDKGELQQLDAAGARRVALGPRVLRTETAGLAALAACQIRYGDMGG